MSSDVGVDLSATTGDCRIRHQTLPPVKEKVIAKDSTSVVLHNDTIMSVKHNNEQ